MRLSSRLQTTVLLSTFLACGVWSSVAHAFTVPANDGYVTDEAGVLSSDERDALNLKLADYQKQSSNEIAILLVHSMSGADIVQSAVDTGRAWGVGTKDKNNGILILIAVDDHLMTMQVGYGLEGVVPDIVAKGVIDTDITPSFREGKYADGLQAGIDALEKHIGGEYKADRYAKSTSGVLPFLLAFFFILINFGSSWMARSKSFWAGGVFGGVFGILLTFLYGWWLAIPGFVILGLIFDFVVSRNNGGPRNRRGGGGFGGFGGGGFGGGSSGGGGFGGFGGGSFGGGGASGKW